MLGNIKSNVYEKGMSQNQVWNLTSKQKLKIKELEKKYREEDELLLKEKS